MRRHNGHIAGQKAALQPPIWEPEGGRMSSFVVIIRRYRDKRPPSSPIVEPESGQAACVIVVKFAICRGVRSRQGFAPAGTQIGADSQHRADMSET